MAVKRVDMTELAIYSPSTLPEIDYFAIRIWSQVGMCFLRPKHEPVSL